MENEARKAMQLSTVLTKALSGSLGKRGLPDSCAIEVKTMLKNVRGREPDAGNDDEDHPNLEPRRRVVRL